LSDLTSTGKQRLKSAPLWRPAENLLASQSGQEFELSLVDLRKKIYQRSVTGWFARFRLLFVVLTQALFYGLPWMSWNGRQALLFDLGARKFYIFGMVLWPQDVIYLTLLLIISALGLFLFTTVAGRLFCGYACPQTVYTELFMWIERRIEGDRVARIRLDEAAFSLHKFQLKFFKHSLWFLLALWTGFTFVGYFNPIRDLAQGFVTRSVGAWSWFWLFFYSFATWGNAGFLREQVCKYMCPYARFQSVMVDRDTLVVTYDVQRGEPRGARSAKTDHRAVGLGDCVNCNICVQVCPTGIDIRQGLQYMCIGCGACVDVCNQVMKKIHYPTGLIRYTSARGIFEQLSSRALWGRVFRPRVLIYSTILLMLVTSFVVLLATRNTLRVDVIRDRGVLGRELAGGLVENVYRLQLINTAESPIRLKISAEGLGPASVTTHGQAAENIELAAASNLIIPIAVRTLTGSHPPGSITMHFLVQAVQPQDHPSHLVREASSFIFPN
jgi:cytochrome c oxidase accessory protein FixG